MSKNIVICCDGTGNEVGAREYTNVVRLYARLLKSDSQQVVFYDPGLGTLGTPGFRTRTLTSATRLIGLMFGYGLQENLKDAYLFLMRHFEPGDKVFLFGFSRGAYTVRALAGMLSWCGLLRQGNENLIEHALKRYFIRLPKRAKTSDKPSTRRAAPSGDEDESHPDWKGLARIKKHFSRACEVEFIGVWDTVKSIGILRRSLVLPGTANLRGVHAGRHAVSLSEKRSKYRPNLWDRPNSSQFKQVWFAGVHSDVGGGYEATGLSDIALEWMLAEAEPFGLRLIPPEDKAHTPVPDPLGRLHNPLLPLWWILGWWRRRIAPQNGEESPWIHESVKTREAADPRFARECRRQIPPNAVYVRTPTPQNPASV